MIKIKNTINKKQIFRSKFSYIIIILVVIQLVFFIDRKLDASDNFEYVTVKNIVNKIKKRFANIECYSANFNITIEKMGKKTQQNGRIKTLFPNNLLVEFFNPPGQKIVSDGEKMWIYIPSLNLVAKQDIDQKSKSIFSSNTKKGLIRLFAKYHYKFAVKEQPKLEKDGNKYYILYLKQKESRSGYRNFTLWVNEDFLITKAVGKTSSGKKVEIVFSKIRTDESFKKGIFRFNFPKNARVINNPMISEE